MEISADDENSISTQQLALEAPTCASPKIAPPSDGQTAPENSLKIEVTCSFNIREVEPPRHETMEKRLPSLPTPFLDLPKLQQISFCFPFPVTRLSSINVPSSSISQHTGTQRLIPHEKPSNSRSLVHVPARCGLLKTARRQALNRVGIPSWSGDKKLLAAVNGNDVHTINHLLQEGVSPNVSDAKKRTGLHIAVSHGHNHIVSILTARGADPNRMDILGNTPLHLAACRGDTVIVRILIGSGANIHKKDNTGRMPLDIVKSRLNTLRHDKSVSKENLIRECEMICELLKFNANRLSYQESAQVDALCTMMADVSTREQADKCADAVLTQMSSLSLRNSTRGNT